MVMVYWDYLSAFGRIDINIISIISIMYMYILYIITPPEFWFCPGILCPGILADTRCCAPVSRETFWEVRVGESG